MRRWLVGLALVAGLAVALTEARASFAYAAEKQSVAGVANFGRVDAGLYRGAQPNDTGFEALRRLGIDSVISFTLAGENAAAERLRVESLGMHYLNLPWSATGEPTADQVDAFLGYFKDHPDRTVFVHCWQGVDRTGTMVALYRIVRDGWTPDHALDEMKAFHYHFIFQPHLQRYVERFGRERMGRSGD